MKCIPTLIATLFTLTGFGQKDRTVFLKWKIQPGELLSYKTVTQEIDTANFKGPSIDMGAFSDLYGDSLNKMVSQSAKLFEEINKSIRNPNLITNLTESRKGIIDIAMSTNDKDQAPMPKNDSSTKNDSAAAKTIDMIQMMRKMNGNIVLRGAITDNGAIQSFYVKYDQRNLIALFFELPDKPIRIGDKWALDVHMISMDQNFKCDSSFSKNIVTLVDLKQVGNETIAVIGYDLQEYVLGDFNNPFSGDNKKTMMKTTYRAIGEFSIDRGRWKSYDGIMSISASGFVTSQTTKKFTLLVNR